MRNLDRQGLKNLIKTLICIQFFCSLLGFVDVSYTYVPLIHLGIAFFGWGAFASNSQALTRAYAVLLFCAVLLDISWFVHCWYNIHSMSREGNEMWLFISSLAMEIVGFCLRFFSSLLWIRMYRLGSVPHVDSTTGASQEDRNAEILRRLLHRTGSYSSSNDDPDAVIGDISSEDTNFFYPDQQQNVNSPRGHDDGILRDESASSAETTEIQSSPVAADGVLRNESASNNDFDDGSEDADQQHNGHNDDVPRDESASSAEIPDKQSSRVPHCTIS